MATQVASLYGVLSIDDSDWTRKLRDADTGMSSFGRTVSSVGSNIAGIGAKMTLVTAPLAIGLGLAAKSALDFDKSMTNVGAVLGKNAAEMKPLNAQILKLGASSVAGPQAVADAFYDIVGGVADASTHMAILETAIATSEAGAADLGATTKALISVMNSYGFEAEEATYASDVLTRTVGMGVGTMDEFAAALPSVTGLANSLGISFGDVGAMAAFLTTKGNTASESMTQLSGMMTSLLNPNETMKKALQELGYTSGEAAIKQLGLVGTFEKLQGTQTVAEKGMAEVVGRVEALRGATALATPDFKAFADTFTGGIEGATAAAQKIQLESASAQFAKLQSEMSALGIEIGSVLLPILVDLVEQVKPVIAQILEWVQQNPEATKTIVALTGAVLILGPLISGLGIIIGVIGSVITGATAIIGLFGTGITALGGFAGVTSASLFAMLLPIAAVTAAALAAVAALKSVIDFHNQVSAAAGKAQSDVAALQASGANITRQQLEDQAFKSISAEYGGGIAGDIAARFFYSNVANAVQGDTVMSSGRVGGTGGGVGNYLGNRDSGGSGFAGQPVMIGTGAQPELFVPSSAGTFYPNAGGAAGGGSGMGDMIIQNMTVVTPNAADFEQQMRDRRRMRG